MMPANHNSHELTNALEFNFYISCTDNLVYRGYNDRNNINSDVNIFISDNCCITNELETY